MLFITKHRDKLLFLLMLILVPLAGEPKLHPFGGEFQSFRVSFGSPVFLLFLLWFRNVSLPLAGIATGISVVLFRSFLDAWAGADFIAATYSHIPTYFYYFSYAFCFRPMAVNKENPWQQSLKIACWAIFAELIASVVELGSMQIFVNHSASFLTIGMFLRLLFIAVLRCFFILSFFFLVQLYFAEIKLKHESHEKNRLTLLISDLYEETVQLKKSISSAEKVTHNCYELYEAVQKNAKSDADNQLAQKLLLLAGQMHDVKKDNQRIFAGLSELTANRQLDDYISADRLNKLIVRSQQKYAKALNKTINFTYYIDKELPVLHVFTVASLINNLIANAVEAIKNKGTITISLEKNDTFINIKIMNTGSFIPPRRLANIFTPGYTTKYDANGKAGNGVGLTYVKDMVTSLDGNITITSDGKDSVECQLNLPLNKITKDGVQN